MLAGPVLRQRWCCRERHSSRCSVEHTCGRPALVDRGDGGHRQRADVTSSAEAGARVSGAAKLLGGFFHHLEKTAGTTVRSILQRHAQLGEFELMSFVNRFDKLQFQMVFHRLWTLLRQPGGLAGLRLAVEIHIGGHLRNPYFLKYTLPDLLLVRDSLRAAGCRCHLVTMLRHPLLQHLSWHYHFCNHRVPLCFWNNPPDCQARMAMGMTCHDGPHLEPLREPRRRALLHVAHLRPRRRHRNVRRVRPRAYRPRRPATAGVPQADRLAGHARGARRTAEVDGTLRTT